MSQQPSGTKERLTVDELAAAVGMTVRNVRAYAGRGLIPPPYLVGRTGYYDERHVSRLRLIRDLVERGFTLTAVERALRDQAGSNAAHALDLIRVIDQPLRDAEEAEVMSRDELAALAGIVRDDNLVDRLTELGLAEPIGGDRLRLESPTVVRAGAQAIRLGLDPDTVFALLPVVTTHVRAIAEAFVAEVHAQIWRPFVEAGMPEEDWPRVLGAIETLLPVASQAVLAVFRNELSDAVSRVMGSEL